LPGKSKMEVEETKVFLLLYFALNDTQWLTSWEEVTKSQLNKLHAENPTIWIEYFFGVNRSVTVQFRTLLKQVVTDEQEIRTLRKYVRGSGFLKKWLIRDL